MARFLTATETSAAIERVIATAEKEVTIISAYVYPKLIHMERLMEASLRGVRVVLVFGKRQLDADVEAELLKIPTLVLYYMKQLHAKCYLNEREAVITSMNLLNSPKAENREMGVLLDQRGDREAFHDAVREVRSIIRAAALLHGIPTTSAALQEESIAGWERRVARLHFQSPDLKVDEKIRTLRETHARAYFSWTTDEEEIFNEMVAAGLTIEAISTILKRQPSAIKGRFGV